MSVRLGLIASLAFNLAASALSLPVRAATLTTLAAFNTTDGAYPRGRLAADAAGHLYGTAVAGGSMNCYAGCGTVFRLSPPPQGQARWTLKVLFRFSGDNGAGPSGGVIIDSAGNLYGTTAGGGIKNRGTVFRLSPPAAGQTAWALTTLVAFDGADGKVPEGSLLADGAGNLYGTTRSGGDNHACHKSACGTVFRLSPPAGGQTTWTKQVLVSFVGSNGAEPYAGLVLDASGSLYGTTVSGGDKHFGTVFRLSPPAAGAKGWTATVLAAFRGPDGHLPSGGLIFDAAGNLYGTAAIGGDSTICGAYGCGTVFRLSPPIVGQTAWTVTRLVSFDRANGASPTNSLIADQAGNLYGTASRGGGSECGEGAGCGTVFRLSPPAEGRPKWTLSTIAAFSGRNGSSPDSDLIADAAGNLYGTAGGGGTSPGCTGACSGTVFRLSP